MIVALTGLGLLGLQACGQNPLMRSARADFAPIRVGSQWSYRDPNSGSGFTREVVASGQAQGRDAFTLVETTAGVPATKFWSYQAGQLENYDASLGGWTLMRRLPYVSGNKWPVATGQALVTALQEVEGFDTVNVPAGKFDACYRLKTTISTYDPVGDVTSTTEALVWSAPNVGDVRYATVDGSGTTTINLELSSYGIPR